MNALRLHAEGHLKLHEEPRPEPGPGETLVRVTAVGLCGSDLHWFEEGSIGDARIERPLVLGHEFAGEVAEGPRAGTRVAIDPAINCGSCRHCLEGNENLCPHVRFAGHKRTDGALREYMAWPTRLLHPLPDELSDVEGAMLEPLGVAIHAAKLGKIGPGSTSAVLGAGPIGLLIIQVVIARGARVILATDRYPHRIDLARKLGAESTHQVEMETEPMDRLDVDVVFDAATSDHTLQTAMEIARHGGVVVAVGIPPSDESVFTASVARRKGLTIRLQRRMGDTYPEALNLARTKQADLDAIVSHQFALADYDVAFSTAARRVGHKVVVLPNA